MFKQTDPINANAVNAATNPHNQDTSDHVQHKEYYDDSDDDNESLPPTPPPPEESRIKKCCRQFYRAFGWILSLALETTGNILYWGTTHEYTGIGLMIAGGVVLVWMILGCFTRDYDICCGKFFDMCCVKKETDNSGDGAAQPNAPQNYHSIN